MTVNGLISDPGDTMDWITEMFNDEMLREISNRQRQVDTLLLGRITYGIMESYWLNAGAGTKNATAVSYVNNTHKIVFSKTLPGVEWNNSTLVREIDTTEIRQWQTQQGQDLAIIGSASIAQAFINLGLVDEYQFLIHPLMLPKGKPLFRNIKERHALKPIRTETYKNGVVCLCYEPSGRH